MDGSRHDIRAVLVRVTLGLFAEDIFFLQLIFFNDSSQTHGSQTAKWQNTFEAVKGKIIRRCSNPLLDSKYVMYDSLQISHTGVSLFFTQLAQRKASSINKFDSIWLEIRFAIAHAFQPSANCKA